ncbi:hypothetical protein [Anaerosacchariphilus polymeriproducens]|uniref:Uncharacterized protein n=1 Tax=Anaerosacchariphilus polymeriproducens TaxID=1812858 RepID=A0A371AZX1_9FIRM|nr:hypothetical protein [Anaerosacchariphilus polymeriproducens]RDU25042.1 hypothetical protein DWV06_01240 [Anaerosacchariphilus polymeriproducens]
MKIDVWKDGKMLYENKGARELVNLLGYSLKSIRMWATGERICSKGYILKPSEIYRPQRRIPQAVLDEWDEIYKNAQVLKQWDSMHKYARR